MYIVVAYELCMASSELDVHIGSNIMIIIMCFYADNSSDVPGRGVSE